MTSQSTLEKVSSVVEGEDHHGGIYKKKKVEITSGIRPVGLDDVSHTGVTKVKNKRESEKKDMQHLNERFASYIENAFILGVQNQRLLVDIEQLKSNWGNETSAIKKIYETELEEITRLLEEKNIEKNTFQARFQTMQVQLNGAKRSLQDANTWRRQDRETFDKLNQLVSKLEGEIRMLRRSNESLDTDRARDEATISRLQEELETLRVDLSNNTIARLNAESKYQILLDQMDLLRSVHEQEMKDLSALAYRDTSAENIVMWKNELSQAIRDIQQQYDLNLDQIRRDMETFYKLKVEEFQAGNNGQNRTTTRAREETKALRKQLGESSILLAKLKDRNAQLEKQYQDYQRELGQKDYTDGKEIDSMIKEINRLREEKEDNVKALQTLMDAKLSLELEIAAYRRLLEGWEAKVGLRQIVERSLQSGSVDLVDSNNVSDADSQIAQNMINEEFKVKTTFQRVANGPVSIVVADQDGKCIRVENKSSEGVGKEMNLDGWKIRRIVDNDQRGPYEYTFRNFVLKPTKSVNIFPRSQATKAGPNDLVFNDADTWGAGVEAVTSLINEKGVEKASCTQKINYTQ